MAARVLFSVGALLIVGGAAALFLAFDHRSPQATMRDLALALLPPAGMFLAFLAGLLRRGPSGERDRRS